MHHFTCRVYYENTDFSGRVYHAEYLKFMERARSEFLRSLGINHQTLAQENMFFVVHHLEISFKSAAIIDDEIVAETQLLSLSPVSFTLGQNLFCSPRLLTQSLVKIALIKEDGRPSRLPPQLLGALDASQAL